VGACVRLRERVCARTRFVCVCVCVCVCVRADLGTDVETKIYIWRST
jgi:hypothetical protein